MFTLTQQNLNYELDMMDIIETPDEISAIKPCWDDMSSDSGQRVELDDGKVINTISIKCNDCYLIVFYHDLNFCEIFKKCLRIDRKPDSLRSLAGVRALIELVGLDDPNTRKKVGFRSSFDEYKHGNIGNQHAAKDDKADTHMHLRVKSSDKASWVKAAGGKLAPWVVETLNSAAQNNK